MTELVSQPSSSFMPTDRQTIRLDIFYLCMAKNLTPKSGLSCVNSKSSFVFLGIVVVVVFVVLAVATVELFEDPDSPLVMTTSSMRAL